MKTNEAKAQARMVSAKKRILKCMERSLGIVTTACLAAKVGRATYYEYLASDAEFAAAVMSLEDVALDFAESSLFVQIRNNTPSSTIFYLKTKGKKRGYIEQIDVGGVANQPVQIVSITQDEYAARQQKLMEDDDC